jgi:hypothetical protein
LENEDILVNEVQQASEELLANEGLPVNKG